MELLSIIHCLAAIPVVGGVMILVILAPKPQTFIEHAQGVGRILMLGGAAFSAARILGGGHPHFEETMLMIGLAIGICIYARENHLLAKAQEHLEDGQESGV